MYRRLTLAICALLFLTASLVHAAQITRIPPREPVQIFGSGTLVFLNGEIDADTPKQLEAFIQTFKVDRYSTIYLNSPGGNLFAGMEIGRLIRKYGLSTSIGQLQKPNGELNDIGPGACYSSCTLAFLGGKFRYVGKDDVYGVHRFSSTTELSNEMDVAQITSAAIINYLKEMEVDVQLFELMTKAGSDQIYQPQKDELERLNVVNNGFVRPVWTIESNGGALYLKGERETIFGINKFIVLCGGSGSGKLVLFVIFDPQGRTEEAVSFSTHTLVLDGKYFPVVPGFKSIENGWFNGVYDLSNELWSKLANSKTVGLMVRAAEDAPVFLGFDSMPFEEGRLKLSGLRDNCR